MYDAAECFLNSMGEQVLNISAKFMQHLYKG
jgi:hypothetical protein